MQSRVFRRLAQKRGLCSPGAGKKGTPTKVLRIQEDALIELDILISLYSARIAASPSSPRYHFLRQFLDELEDVVPEE